MGTQFKNKKTNSKHKTTQTLSITKTQTILKTKLLIYKTIIRPIGSKRIQIWESTKPSNIRPIQAH